MTKVFFEPILDWSGLSNVAEKEVVIPSREQWFKFYTYLCDLQNDHYVKDRAFVIEKIHEVLSLMVTHWTFLTYDRDEETLRATIKHKLLIDDLVFFIRLRGDMLETLSDGSQELFIDLFDIDVAIDTIAKIINQGHDMQMLNLTESTEKFNSAAVKLGAIDYRILDIFFQEVPQNV